MKHLYLLLTATLLLFSARGQVNNNLLYMQPVDYLPVKHQVVNPPYGTGPTNEHKAYKETAGGTTYNDWYDLWDEQFDTTSMTLPHSYLFQYDIYPDSNILDTTGYYPPYQIFTHGMGMSFDPTDSAYYYNAFNPAYRVTAPFPCRKGNFLGLV